MARLLRLYSNPIAATAKAKDISGSQLFNRVLRAPINVSPISHIIMPNTTGLNPNAHLTPLMGYYIRYKGKIMDKTLRSNTFKFRTGVTNKSNYRGYHYSEGYSVTGPMGSLGIYVYYEYDLENYFTNTDVWIPKKKIHDSIKNESNNNNRHNNNNNNINNNMNNMINLNSNRNHTTDFVDENETYMDMNKRRKFDQMENRMTRNRFQDVEDEF